ncbi:tripartite tricarboxylate transporter TctB family protein [Brachybacterium sp. p3-SID957]|uniref:tripartite tricarboxylate transporter TctB family protein n=1 Tax=Brachybacterium sp. p3-SID957 TaxID=2916049 RepID=UPI00223C08A4|nr:tripartite tricarboxylate transporter TctB family protein [Brachybacterium sp. p3-SID957]MCT1776501.1 tripartite tricarboxylate transporter TctB family protein [Brachybacterium sp. p3-SID957]
MTDSTVNEVRERPRPKTSDVVGTGLLGVLGALALIMGLGYGFLGEDGQIGPGFMPVATGGFILLASRAEIGRMYLAPAGQGKAGIGGLADELSAEAAASQATAHRETNEIDEDVDTFGRTAKQRRLTVPLIFGILLAAILLTQVIGLLLSLTVMMFAIVVFVEKKPLVPAVLASLAVLAVAYLIFVQLLGVPLPQGMLGIL